MENPKKLFVVMLVCILQLVMTNQNAAKAQSTDGIYTVTVNTPGTFGQVMLQTVENWSDVVELTIKGTLNNSDMAYFSRMLNLEKLDLAQTAITTVAGCNGLTSLQTVVLPESVIAIEDEAFNSCTSLSSINLSNINIIGSSAFYECRNLSGNLNLPNTIVIEALAFYNCINLNSVSMPVVEEIGRRAFSINYGIKNSSKLTSVIMPKVKTIGYEAFKDCSKLQSIDIPNCISLGSIDNTNEGGCFEGCLSLKSVTLSENLEYIPYETFQNTGLKTIKLPSSLKAIGKYAFASSPITTIDIIEGVTIIEHKAFYGCPLVDITLPSTLEYIGSDAFFHQEQNYNSSTGKYDYSYVLKDVYCKSVVPLITSAFNNDMAKGATLHVPTFSVSAYKLDDNWYKFNKIEAIDGALSDVTINNAFTIIDYSGLANNANLTLTSSESQQTAGHLTISSGTALSLNNYIQAQNFHYQRNDDYDENGNHAYRYSYPYCTTMISDNEVRANNVTTKILRPTNQWSFISMPYDVNVSDIVVPTGVMWVVRKYNGANRAAMSGNTWEDVAAGQTLNAGEGYIFHCVSDEDEDSWNTSYVEFEFPAVNNANKNNIFSYNDILKTIKEYPAEFPHNRGWNLIGNPYPSYFSSKHIDFPAPITVWNGEGYTAYSLADDEYVLRPNEAFFVQCPVSTKEIRFSKDGRTHDYISSSNSVRSRANVSYSNNRSILNFVLSTETYSDRTRLVINDAASSDYEIERDASKFMSINANVPQIYIVDNGINYAINERPLGTGEYVLGVKGGQEGSYKISLNTVNSDYDVTLVDKETGETVDLTQNGYTFNSSKKSDNNRFVVRIGSKGSMTSVDSIETETAYIIEGNRLVVNGATSICLVSLDGKIIYNGITDGSIELKSGIYLLSINNKVVKIAIK